jgi:hypothetical protein
MNATVAAWITDSPCRRRRCGEPETLTRIELIRAIDGGAIFFAYEQMRAVYDEYVDFCRKIVVLYISGSFAILILLHTRGFYSTLATILRTRASSTNFAGCDPEAR